jgi:hypothetical protein
MSPPFAVRGKYRRSWAALECSLACGIGVWSDSHRYRTLPAAERPGLFNEDGTQEVLHAWYGPEVAAPLIESRERSARHSTRILIGVGLALLLLWLLSFMR